MKRHLRRSGERGVVTVLMMQIAIITFLFMWAVIYIGQMANKREEMQMAADNLTASIATIARKQGIAAICDHPALAYALRSNIGGDPNNPAWAMQITTPCGAMVRTVDDGAGAQHLEITADIQTLHLPPVRLFGEMLHFNDPKRLVTHSVITVPQSNLRDVERKLPRMVLALDFSGSMANCFDSGAPPCPGGKPTRIEALRTAVNILLDVENIEFGGVLFDDGLVEWVDEISDDGPHRDDIHDMTVDNDPDNGTNYEAPLRKAADLLAFDDGPGKGYILLVSDGSPNEGNALHGANAAWLRGYTIITLSIRDIGQPPLADMVNVAGEPGNPGDRNYALAAGSADELRATFRRIAGEVLCRLGPLNPEPDADEDIFAFLIDRQARETRLVPYAGLAEIRDHADDGVLGYAHLRDENKVILTAAACDLVLEQGAYIVARLSGESLVQ